MRQGLENLHMSLGVLVLMLVVVRLAWRGGRFALSIGPGAPDGLAARLVHVLLYAVMVESRFSAWCWSGPRGATSPSCLELPLALAADRALSKIAGGLHEAAAHGLMALAGLHAAAALGHHYLLRDDVLARMLPMARRP